MPRNPQNFWEVLGQAGQAGLGQVGATYAAGKQRERDNALTSFMSVLKQQDADRQTAESMSRMSLLRSKMMESSERLKQLQKSPSEVGAAEGEQQLGQLRAMLSGLTESGNISDIPFTNDIAGGMESVYQGLPPGTDLNLGPLQMSAPEQLRPLDANTQSQIDYRNALTANLLDGGTSPIPKTQSVPVVAQEAGRALDKATEEYRKRQREIEEHTAGMQLLDSLYTPPQTQSPVDTSGILGQYRGRAAELGGGGLFDELIGPSAPTYRPPSISQDADAWGRGQWPDWAEATPEEKQDIIKSLYRK